LPVRVSGLTNVTAIAAAGSTAYALRTDRTVRAWGTGTRGELGNGGTANALVPVQVSGLTNITAIAAGCWADGGGAGYALWDNGTVSAWGWGLYGQLGNGATDTSLVPVRVSGLTNVTAVAANGATGYALRADRTVQAWGRGAWGQLGNGSTDLSTVPVPVFGLTNVTAIAAGSENGYAITH
jgi:alpha-tubulin suppressor-like RCC1 family protein